MTSRSPLHRFIVIRRKFGLFVAMKVTFSKVRGAIWPALALPDAPNLNTTPRELTILLNTAEQSASILHAVVELLAHRDNLEWDLCMSERLPVEPEMAREIACCRGKHPWLRIVTTDRSVDDTTAARWTVEQTTGEFVAILAPLHPPENDAIQRLIAQLRDDPAIDAAALVASENNPRWTDCRLVVQRKSGYLTAAANRWHLTAPALAGNLNDTAAIVAYIPSAPNQENNIPAAADPP